MNKEDRDLLQRILKRYDDNESGKWNDPTGNIDRLMTLGYVRSEAFQNTTPFNAPKPEYFQLGSYPLTLRGYEELTKNWYDRLSESRGFRIIRDLFLLGAFVISIVATVLSIINASG